MTTKLSERLRAIHKRCYQAGERHSLPNETSHFLQVDVIDDLEKAIVQAEAQEAQAGELSDFHYNVLKERMIEEHRKYGDKLRFGHWADIAARKVVSHLRDMGYLRPSQAIGEHTPVAWMTEDGRLCHHTSRMDMSEVLKAAYRIPLYRSPMSSDARDLAVAVRQWIPIDEYFPPNDGELLIFKGNRSHKVATGDEVPSWATHFVVMAAIATSGDGSA